MLENFDPLHKEGSVCAVYPLENYSMLLIRLGDDLWVKAASGYMKIVPHMSSDELRVLIRSDQTLASLCMSLTASPRYDFVNIYGTKGTLKVDFLNKCIITDKDTSFLPAAINRSWMNVKTSCTLLSTSIRNTFDLVRGKYSQFDGVERVIQLFYESIITDRPVPVSPEEGLKSMEIMDEIWKQIGSLNHDEKVYRKLHAA